MPNDRRVADTRELLRAARRGVSRHGYEGATLALITQGHRARQGQPLSLLPRRQSSRWPLEVLARDRSLVRGQHFRPVARSRTARPRAIAETTLAGVDRLTAAPGRRVCLVGVIALGARRATDFRSQVQDYFSALAAMRWYARCAGPASGFSAVAARQTLRRGDAYADHSGARWCWRGRARRRQRSSGRRAMAEYEGALLLAPSR